MVGGEGDRRRAAADELTAGLRAAYSDAAGAWASGPERAYAALAQALIAAAGVPVRGQRVLDLGAGTGVVGRAALAAGARQVVAVDFAAGMLRHAGQALHPVAADATALPFRDHSFGLVLMAFCLSHLPDPAAGLAEVHRAGRALAASSFAPGWSHPAKAATDEALRSFGYQPPAWYVTFKDETEPAAADPRQLAAHAERAGFRTVRLRTLSVPTGLCTPRQLAAWRLGMAQVAPFVRSLNPSRRAALRRAVCDALAGTGPLVVSMLVLTAS